MEKTPVKKKSASFVLICVLGFVAAALIVPAIMYHPLRETHPWFSYYLVAVMVVSVLSLLGIWKLKRWAFLVYAILFGVNQAIFALLIGGWLYLVLVLPVVVLVFSYRYFADFE